MQDVKKSLRVLRAELGLSQKKFANMVGIPFSTYQKKETGCSPITLEEAYKIAEVTRKTINDIFFTN